MLANFFFIFVFAKIFHSYEIFGLNDDFFNQTAINETNGISNDSKNEKSTYDLVQDILEGYRRHVKPVSKASETVKVNITASLYQIISIEQTKNLIKISAFFELSWYDAFLKWNPEDYENSKSIFIPASLIWMPEVFLYYSVDEKSSMLLTNTGLDVEVKHTGLVRYFLPFTANSLCPLNVKYFPFDEQTCQLMFGSWAHTTESTIFRSSSNELYLGDFYDNQEWILTNGSLKDHLLYYVNLDGNHSYSAVVMVLKIQRQSFYYVFNLVLPSALISFVALIGFHLPSASTQGRASKFQHGIMTLLSMAVLLLSVVTHMPKFSSHAIEGQRGSFSSVPLIGIYYFSLLTLIGLGTVTSSFFVMVERYCITNQPPVPFYLKWLAYSPDWRRWRKRRRGRKFPSASQNHTEETFLSKSPTPGDQIQMIETLRTPYENSCEEKSSVIPNNTMNYAKLCSESYRNPSKTLRFTQN